MRCPTWLDTEAKKYWQQNAPKLEKLGTLTDLTADTFALVCQLYSDFKSSTSSRDRVQLGNTLRAFMKPFLLLPGKTREKATDLEEFLKD